MDPTKPRAVLAQVANALRASDSFSFGAAVLGRGAVDEGAVVIALDQRDRDAVFTAVRAERRRRGLSEPRDERVRSVSCVMPMPGHFSQATDHDPAAGHDQALVVTPRAVMAVIEEAEDRILQLEAEVARLRSDLDVAQLEVIERQEEVFGVDKALDACGFPRAAASGGGLTTEQRARAAAICASYGWRTVDVTIAGAANGRNVEVKREAETASVAGRGTFGAQIVVDWAGGPDRAVLAVFRDGRFAGHVELKTTQTLTDADAHAMMSDRAQLGDDRAVAAAEVVLSREGTPTMSVDEARAYLVRLWNARAARELIA